MKKRRTLKDYNQFIQYSSLAIEMVVIMGLGVFAGIKIDDWLNLNFPVFTLVLMVLSFIGAIYHAIRNFIKKK
jgi:F0F1-type ATP synthase assembly protein I